MPPSGIDLGFIYIRFYGILIMIGVILAAYLAASLAKKNKQDPERIWDMLPWALVFGIIGARLWHILTPPPSMVARGVDTMYYLTHPLDALAVCQDAGARTLALYHHAPERTDAEVDRMLSETRAVATQAGGAGAVIAAYEGLSLTLGRS